ncbi:MAG: hypothetical protein GY738_04570 [Pseudoalteromonas sp.]|nr:hypothetical protein [Pseudoalteromonas sp.]
MKEILDLIEEINKLDAGKLSISVDGGLKLIRKADGARTTNSTSLLSFLKLYKTALIELAKPEVVIVPSIHQRTSLESLDIGEDYITKTGVNGWGSGTFSTQGITGDGFVSFKLKSENKNMYVGLSSADTSGSFESIHSSFFITMNNGFEVKSGKSRLRKADTKPYEVGDVFKIQRTNGKFSFYVNGELVFSPDVINDDELFVDTAFYHKGASIEDIRLVDE